MDTVLIEALVNMGMGAIVVLLIIFDLLVPGNAHKRLLKENENLKEALALERQRADAATQAGAVTNQLIGGIVQLAAQNREHAVAASADAHVIAPLTERSVI